MEKYTVKIAYPAYAVYDIEAENPEKAIAIARKKDLNCEKDIEEDFEVTPKATVINKYGQVLHSVTPTEEKLHDTLYNITRFAKAKYRNNPDKACLYLLGIGFTEDLLEYFNIKEKNKKKETITFDDFHKDEDTNSTWTYICNECIKKYNINKNLLDIASDLLDNASSRDYDRPDDSPICGIKGCNNVADAYLDFPNNIKQPDNKDPEMTVNLKNLQ